MTKSTKAALVSGLVFPGLGHIYLRRYVVGAIFVCLAGWSIYTIADSAIDTAIQIAGEIERGGVAIDSGSIGELVAQRSRETEESTGFAGWLLMASWIIAIIDAYRLGRADEQRKT